MWHFVHEIILNPNEVGIQRFFQEGNISENRPLPKMFLQGSGLQLIIINIKSTYQTFYNIFYFLL